jgi:small subunit ribosomal protein S6
LTRNAYEGMFIFDSNRYARDASGISAHITEMIQKFGGEVLVSRLWEERRLAYPIAGHRKGTYWLSYFKLDSNQVATIERECHLNENILRSLILKVEPRIVDALVSHALAGPEAARPRRSEPEVVVPKSEEVVVDAIGDIDAVE